MVFSVGKNSADNARSSLLWSMWCALLGGMTGNGQVRTSEITATIRSLSFNLPSEVRCEVRGCNGKIREELELGARSSGGWRKMSKLEEMSNQDFGRY